MKTSWSIAFDFSRKSNFWITALCLTAGLSGLSGCASLYYSDFEIVGNGSSVADRAFILSRNNLLSLHTSSGLIKTADEGFFANPAYLNGSWFLLVENVTNQADPGQSNNRLNNISSMILTVDENRFAVESSENNFLRKDQPTQVNLWGDRKRDGYEDEFSRETATFQLTEDQLISIINAKELEIAVIGSARHMVFKEEKIAESFQANLFDFYHAAKLEKVSRAEF